ncbi:MAG: 3-hydroxyacyl-CoA dehydrogenase family protein [Rhizobiales bacterium]|nr:3-hydroxyacyl-CoA dehydrogenase family protein [Hyphomicrobiales bacterium]NRB14293.1 3-hydroxyacyl-CoA dehydrogenase family protein [Hyphomicrobiales bacterium]
MIIKTNISIIGAGLMGHGLAQVFAFAGHRVKVYDAHQIALDSLHDRIVVNLKSLGQDVNSSANIEVFSSLEDAVKDADFVFEAAPEKLEIKRAIFADLVKHAPKNAVLASNTSAMPITGIGENLPTNDRILGTHWWNPPFLVPLVEVVSPHFTDQVNVEKMMSLLSSVGKSPVHIKKDVVGFVGNRLQMALWREAIAIVEDGIADAETVDTVVKQSFGRRLAVLGPLENADLIGTDLTLDIHNTILKDLSRATEPSKYLKMLVADGRLGMKSGEGFKSWSKDQAQRLRNTLFDHLKNFK